MNERQVLVHLYILGVTGTLLFATLAWHISAQGFTGFFVGFLVAAFCSLIPVIGDFVGSNYLSDSLGWNRFLAFLLLLSRWGALGLFAKLR